MSDDLGAVRRTEELLLNAWPSLRTMMSDGWVIREADGYTKRANSASALDAKGDFLPTLRRTERFYASMGRPAVFRLTPLAGSEPDQVLEEHGFHVLDETIVMTAPLGDAPRVDGAVTIEPERSSSWVVGFRNAHALDSQQHRAHLAILDNIRPLATGYAAIWNEGRPIAFGLGVVEREHLGVFDVITVPEARRQGAARALVTALMMWGAERGATSAWLSVIGTNERALPLYAQLGFRELYRYHYRAAPPQEGFSVSSRASFARNVYVG